MSEWTLRIRHLQKVTVKDGKYLQKVTVKRQNLLQ